MPFAQSGICTRSVTNRITGTGPFEQPLRDVAVEKNQGLKSELITLLCVRCMCRFQIEEVSANGPEQAFQHQTLVIRKIFQGLSGEFNAS